MVTAPKQSLRDRKRAATWASIHQAAAAAAMEQTDLSKVTIEDIAAQANISPRTFFNYFASKEDAILGLRAPFIDDGTAETFAFGDDDNLIEKVALLLFDVFEKTAAGSGGRQVRVGLMHRHPELARIRLAHTEKIRHLAQALVEARLADSDRWRGRGHDIEIEAAAQVLVTAGQSVVRIAFDWLITDPGVPLDDLVHRAAQTFTTILEEA